MKQKQYVSSIVMQRNIIRLTLSLQFDDLVGCDRLIYQKWTNEGENKNEKKKITNKSN